MERRILALLELGHSVPLQRTFITLTSPSTTISSPLGANVLTMPASGGGTGGISTIAFRQARWRTSTSDSSSWSTSSAPSDASIAPSQAVARPHASHADSGRGQHRDECDRQRQAGRDVDDGEDRDEVADQQHELVAPILRGRGDEQLVQRRADPLPAPFPLRARRQQLLRVSSGVLDGAGRARVPERRAGPPAKPPALGRGQRARPPCDRLGRAATGAVVLRRHGHSLAGFWVGHAFAMSLQPVVRQPDVSSARPARPRRVRGPSARSRPARS